MICFDTLDFQSISSEANGKFNRISGQHQQIETQISTTYRRRLIQRHLSAQLSVRRASGDFAEFGGNSLFSSLAAFEEWLDLLCNYALQIDARWFALQRFKVSMGNEDGLKKKPRFFSPRRFELRTCRYCTLLLYQRQHADRSGSTQLEWSINLFTHCAVCQTELR
jgi:hypothetical protein